MAESHSSYFLFLVLVLVRDLLLPLFSRIYMSRIVKNHVATHLLESTHWFNFWFYDFRSSVLLYSFSDCSVIADVTAKSERNKWLSTLDGVNSAAWVVAPALGAALLKVSNQFPL